MQFEIKNSPANKREKGKITEKIEEKLPKI